MISSVLVAAGSRSLTAWTSSRSCSNTLPTNPAAAADESLTRALQFACRRLDALGAARRPPEHYKVQEVRTHREPGDREAERPQHLLGAPPMLLRLRPHGLDDPLGRLPVRGGLGAEQPRAYLPVSYTHLRAHE